MLDHSILELEEIESKDRLAYEVIKEKYLTYRDAGEFEAAEAMTKALRIHHNHLTEGWLLRAECIHLNKSPKEAAKILILDENYFSEEAEVLFAIGKYLSLAEEPLRARNYIRRAIKLDNRYRKKLLEDKAFDQVWDSFA